jgi:hypothetical protein
MKFSEWIKIKEAGVPYVGQNPGNAAGGWQGAPSHGKLSSVGEVRPKKKKKHK